MSCEAGAVDAVRGWHEWLLRHRTTVEAALDVH
ncbi:hypothetical protein GA0074695_2032 [Micromonospora viridifaciens]|uniref:Uncharacterized protein n=1 Tax=Micromonospora viridifaciens TaxID=1881 RepID=A0A1C4W2W8_MICVI|nr:hypothetical protein GA0074695_2032 [Micromonospora viridifaciens]